MYAKYWLIFYNCLGERKTRPFGTEERMEGWIKETGVKVLARTKVIEEGDA